MQGLNSQDCQVGEVGNIVNKRSSSYIMQ